MGFSTHSSSSTREGSKRTPQPSSSDASDANQSNTTSQESVPFESAIRQIPEIPSWFVNMPLGNPSLHPAYLTSPLELDEADYRAYVNSVGRERRTLGTRYSNVTRRTAFIPDDWIQPILESSDVFPEADPSTAGSMSSPSPDFFPVSPHTVRSPSTLALVDELTATMSMDALQMGPVTQPSSPNLDRGAADNGQTSRDGRTPSLSPSPSFTTSSQSSEASLGSVGYKSALTELRATLGPLTYLLSRPPRCRVCDVVLLKPSDVSFAFGVPPYLQELRAVTPSKLQYVLLVCPGCLQPYCGGCGERVKVTDQGDTWFRAAMNCCISVRPRGLLNVLSDLDQADGLQPKIANVLQIINESFVDKRQSVHSLVGPIIRSSKLLNMMDEMFRAFMLDNIPPDSESWRLYDQMTKLMWTFSGDPQLRLLIRLDTYIFPHHAGRTSHWIRDGLPEDWDHGLPTLVSLRRRISVIERILEKYQGSSTRGPKESPYKSATMAHLKAIKSQWR